MSLKIYVLKTSTLFNNIIYSLGRLMWPSHHLSHITDWQVSGHPRKY